MKLSQLEYPIQKKYTIPYLSHVFYVISFLLLCLLVPLNVALVGSDVITTLKSDPSSIDDSWWMPSWPKAFRLRIAQICQPASITDDLALRTNSSVPLFKYLLQHANVAEVDNDPTQHIYPVPYMANQLSDCEVRMITMRMDLPARVMTYKAIIYCSLGGNKEFAFQVPDNITLSTTHHRSANNKLAIDDMIDYLAFNVFPKEKESDGVLGKKPTLGGLPVNSASSSNVLSVLDGMQTDLFSAALAQLNLWDMNNTRYHRTYIFEWAASSGSYCWSSRYHKYNETCGNATNSNRILRMYGTTDDKGIDRDPSFLESFRITVVNMLIAVRDAIMIDLGNLQTSSNIYLNKSYFDEVIQIDPHHAKAGSILTTIANKSSPWYMSSDFYWHFCTWWSCVNTSWAEALKNATEDTPVNNTILPYRPNNTQAISVFNFSYLCPTFQRKPISSLLISVFVATATMFNVLYAIFEFFMPRVETRYQRRKQAMAMGTVVHFNHEDQQEGHSPTEKTSTYNSSNALYDPEIGVEKHPHGRQM